MPTTRQILVKHDKFLSSVVSAFDDALAPLIDKAQKKTLRELEKKLTFQADGTIEFTAANQQVLRSIDRIFGRQMKLAGYDKLVDAYSSSFADHLPLFQDVLNGIVDTVDAKLPDVKFTGADLELFASRALNAKEQLLDVVTATGTAAKRQALFNTGGLSLGDLTSTLASQFGKTASQAKTIADSAVSVFYRTVADHAYRKIENGLPKAAVEYSYAGPDDSLTREFCDELITRDRAYTRDEIDAMDNGQIPDVFTSCGGFNCRHQWILSLADEDAG